jgi:hypothetical protein
MDPEPLLLMELEPLPEALPLAEPEALPLVEPLPEALPLAEPEPAPAIWASRLNSVSSAFSTCCCAVLTAL